MFFGGDGSTYVSLFCEIADQVQQLAMPKNHETSKTYAGDFLLHLVNINLALFLFFSLGFKNSIRHDMCMISLILLCEKRPNQLFKSQHTFPVVLKTVLSHKFVLPEKNSTSTTDYENNFSWSLEQKIMF